MHKLISRSGNAFCNLFSYSSKDSVVTKKPRISDLEDSEENAPIFDDVLYSQDEYSIPIQLLIKNVVNGACHLGCDFDGLHDDFQVFNQASMKILTFYYMMMNVFLFWFIAKYKGRTIYVKKQLGWLHWLYDYTYLLHFSHVE
jgi:hypothetical protein